MPDCRVDWTRTYQFGWAKGVRRDDDPVRGESKDDQGFGVRAGLVCGALVLVAAVVAIVAGGIGGGEQGTALSAPRVAGQAPEVSWQERIDKQEALPCTGDKKPANFEVFSAGPSVSGVPLTEVKRRCGGRAPKDEPPANLTNYIYGTCRIAADATGCEPPLQVQTWPACERSLADYSFEGRPIPYRKLPNVGGAVAVEINFMLDHRIEVYSGSSTVVIFAVDRDLARSALSQLRPQKMGTPPHGPADDLRRADARPLPPPTNGAMQGELQCQS
jgi:hypothetical protein